MKYKKRIFFLLLCLCSCNSSHGVEKLGDKNSNTKWVYLCGLTEDLHSSYAKKNRAILDKIGKNLHIAILAPMPPKRCPTFNNQLCWPHNSEEEVKKTDEYLRKILGKEEIAGYMGFSNGGFFLLKLAEFNSLPPLIVIGAGGYLGKSEKENHITLLIGSQDESHYLLARQFYEQARNSQLDVTLIEYEGGHEIPPDLLELTLQTELPH